MAKRDSSSFGIDQAELSKINWRLALKRIRVDVRSDFIYAPHISSVYRRASDSLIQCVTSELRSGGFAPKGPITIDVPKSARMNVIPKGTRGPSFSRPGSILYPKDRILYQALADRAGALIERHSDRDRSFSHQFMSRSSEMFAPSREAWDGMQKALNRMSASSRRGYIIKADVANCFGSINQHTLVNHLDGIGYPTSLKRALDAFLVQMTGDRSSRGLLQGLFPSDLFGNFYLNPIDQFLDDIDVASVRYVDDIYISARSLNHAEEIVRSLTTKLRDYDLSLNEAKSKLLRSRSLAIEEPDLERLFEKALEERDTQFQDEDDIDLDYGFQSEWEEEEENTDSQDVTADSSPETDLRATEILFDSIKEFPLQVEKIERFCLPIFATAGSDYAVYHVISNFAQYPSMAQIYCSYLSKISDGTKGKRFFERMFLNEELLYDWQRMWLLAALLRMEDISDKVVTAAVKVFKDGTRHEALRAVAAVVVAKHGSFGRQKELADSYGDSGSAYLQTALLYGAKYFQRELRSNSIRSWRQHSDLHSLVAKSIT